MVSAQVPPEANQLFPEYVLNLAYPVEIHNITTADNYINTFFRIQAKNSEMKSGLPVIYLQHGLLDSSDTWIVNAENLAPGFAFANAGFDVWLGNSRGNRYSQAMVGNPNPSPDSSYWDFSWQEMSIYDLPAAFNYISNFTGQAINYIGHSQGTSQMFEALARRDPNILSVLRRFIAIGPVAYVEHATTTILQVAAWSGISKLFNVINDNEFLIFNQPEFFIMENVCYFTPPICEALIQQIADSNTTVDNLSRAPIYFGHFPAGTSVQNLDYWNQMIENYNGLQMYNFGSSEANEQHYGQSSPPYVDIGNINFPVHLFSGMYDELADPTDVQNLYSTLTGSPNVTLNVYPYGHMTFLWGYNTSLWINDALDIINTPSDVYELNYM